MERSGEGTGVLLGDGIGDTGVRIGDGIGLARVGVDGGEGGIGTLAIRKNS